MPTLSFTQRSRRGADRQDSPFVSIMSNTMELANGYNGYLPTPEHHLFGGYETWRAKSSYFEVDASPKLVATLLELFGRLRPKAGVE